MASALNAFTKLGKAKGESTQAPYADWIELQAWEWEVEAETSWTKGGGASVGKPNPGKMTILHYFDTSSTVMLGFICTGKAFPKGEIQVMKTTGKGVPETYLTITVEGVFITKVSNSLNEDGVVNQLVEFVFKTIKIEYKPQNKDGSLGASRTFNWDIPAGTASPTA